MKIPLIPVKFNYEVEVQVYYSRVLCDLLNCPFSVKSQSDGIYDSKNKKLKMLAEYKCGGDLVEDKDLFARCVCQALCYIKKIEDSGDPLPNTIFIANENHFSIFSAKKVEPYLQFVTSDITPSDFFLDAPQELRENIIQNLFAHKYRIDEIEILEDLIKEYEGESGELKMSITYNNIVRIFENFIMSNIFKTKLDYNEQVALFASIIFEECNNIEGKPNQIVTPLTNKKVINIDRSNYESFLQSIRTIEKPSSKQEIISQADRLINEVSRRFHGEFYTPKIWVDEAHRMIEQQFGPNWKEEYVVWDPCCGTGNLTRDYQFKELYCSTLFQSDIDIMNQRGYNPEAVKFQYDFLNDDVYPASIIAADGKYKLQDCAPGLVKSVEDGREILILMNPPFGACGTYKFDGSYKGKISENNTNSFMKGMNKSKEQLYSNFLYRIILFQEKYKNSKINISFFSSSMFITGPGFQAFRNKFFSKFKFVDGFMFNAKHFNDVKEWPILFTVYRHGSESRNIFDFKVKDILGGIVTDVNTQTLYNIDNGIDCKLWLSELTKTDNRKEIPSFSSPLNLATSKEYGQLVRNVDSEFLSLLVCDSNNLEASRSKVYIINGGLISGTGTVQITPTNFYNCISVFSARILSKNILSWNTLKLEFYKPEIEKPGYNKWNIDCIIYSIFNDCSNQASLRSILYKNKQWNIENHFFWLPNQQMMQLADDNNFDEMYQDARVFNQDRFVYQELQKVQLSPDAQGVLDNATELVIKSMPERKRLHSLHPEWHLNAWDAGWYQIKLILKESYKDDLAEFVKIYKEFENRMREGVYKFGFLK